ncbi:MAG: carbohydrate ABC transporter permease [Lachnospiraceae bacterium]|nr:carbohydrate ABC transporter permease [uncultured Acetatifactor sp.]MCI8287144.1 carbohydrate ABC transporter permease [Lachnospiraceae bacterium]
MTLKSKRKHNMFFTYLIILLIGIILLYPIVWMFFATFKTNDEIFNSIKLLPNSFSFQNFIDGWNGSGRVTYATYFLNTFLLVLPTVIFTIVSSCLVAYGFARFKFPGKNILFALLISTLMLPNAIIIVPRYTMFSKLGWINNYMPFYAPAILACYPFFVYMLIQFLRGIPKDLDESAYIDGCGTFRTLVSILLPLMKPALFSAALFQFLWTYNDYFNSLIFINSGSRYTISLALRLSLDSESVVNWGKLMAISFISVTPLFILFFAAQKYFVEGIATSGLKG